MQTYEKCVDYIQTHFMLLREELLLESIRMSKTDWDSWFSLALHYPDYIYYIQYSNIFHSFEDTEFQSLLLRTTSSHCELESNSSCKGVTHPRRLDKSKVCDCIYFSPVMFSHIWWLTTFRRSLVRTCKKNRFPLFQFVPTQANDYIPSSKILSCICCSTVVYAHFPPSYGSSSTVFAQIDR